MRSPGAAVDPRVYQSVVLASLLAWGELGLDFALSPWWIASTIGAALLTQWTLQHRRGVRAAPAMLVRCGRLYHHARYGRGEYHALRSHDFGAADHARYGRGEYHALRSHDFGAADRARFDPWSALISGLSLCLLLRASSVAVAAFAAALAIASKFVLRVGERHLWNPTNFAMVVTLALGSGRVSPGQWGSAAYFGLLVAAAGGFVSTRAARLDVSAAFLGAWAALLFGRALYLGDPLAIPLRQLRSGSLLIFAFYMISDPKTTPRTRGGRVAFAAAVAAGAFAVQFVWYRQDGLLWALAVATPIATLLAALRSRLPHSRTRFLISPGDRHDRHQSSPRPLRARAALVPAGRPPVRPRLLRLLRRQGGQRPLQPQLARRPGA